jgi:transketolase
VAYSITSFATARPFEQIRYCVAYPNLPVVLVGAGRGYTYGNSGVSHHAVDDLALMTALPNMRVVIPGDPGEIETLFPQVLAAGGPTYFTVGRFGEPRFAADEPAVLGRARLLRGGRTIAVITTGEIANEALAALPLLAQRGLTPAVYQMHTVKPLDTAAMDDLARRFAGILVVEEHLPAGGLFAALASWHTSARATVPLARLGPPDAFALGAPDRDELRRRLAYDAPAIAHRVERMWRDVG